MPFTPPPAVPYDAEGHMQRTATPGCDWREYAPLQATLAVWGAGTFWNMVADNPHPFGAYFWLRDVATGRRYPISWDPFCSLPRASLGIDWTGSRVADYIRPFLENATVMVPGPPPEDFPLLPEYWGYSWSGTWVVGKQGKAYTLACTHLAAKGVIYGV